MTRLLLLLGNSEDPLTFFDRYAIVNHPLTAGS